MDALENESPRGRVRRWWNGLSTRGRERVLLGALFAAGLGARDFLLLGSSAVAMAALELADLLPAASRASASG